MFSCVLSFSALHLQQEGKAGKNIVKEASKEGVGKGKGKAGKVGKGSGAVAAKTTDVDELAKLLDGLGEEQPVAEGGAELE